MFNWHSIDNSMSQDYLESLIMLISIEKEMLTKININDR